MGQDRCFLGPALAGVRAAVSGRVPAPFERPATRLRLLVLLLSVGFFAAVAFHYWQGQYEGRRGAVTSFLYAHKWDPHFQTTDFAQDSATVEGNDPYFQSRGWIVPFYPPFAFLAQKALRRLPQGLVICAYALVLLAGVWLVLRRFALQWAPFERAQAAFALTFLNYPFLFALDRVNQEVLAYAGVVLLLLAMHRRDSPAAAAGVAWAATLKLSPAVAGVLFLLRREWKAAALSAALFVALGAAALLTFEAPAVESLAQFLRALAEGERTRNQGPDKVGYTTDVWDAFLVYFTMMENKPAGAGLLLFRAALVALVTGMLVAFLLQWRRGPRDPVLALAALMTWSCLVQTRSYAYKLAHLVPVGLWILCSERPLASRRAGLAYTLVFAALLVPRQYWYVAEQVHQGLDVFLSPALLLTHLLLLTRLAGPEAAPARLPVPAPASP